MVVCACSHYSNRLTWCVPSPSGKKTETNTRLYRAACLFLTIICLVLLLVVIILSVKREYLQPAACLQPSILLAVWKSLWHCRNTFVISLLTTERFEIDTHRCSLWAFSLVFTHPALLSSPNHNRRNCSSGQAGGSACSKVQPWRVPGSIPHHPTPTWVGRPRQETRCISQGSVQIKRKSNYSLSIAMFLVTVLLSQLTK